MAFDLADYRRGAGALAAPSLNLMAVAAVESSGENFWTVNGRQAPPIRPEAHWFSAKTGHRYDQTYPAISSPSWNPALAARSKAEAWQQYELMKSLDANAAAEATSWGPFQIMGFHYKALGYPTVQAFVDDVDGPDDDGQMDMFVRFVRADPRLLKAIREGDWDTWEQVYNGGGYGGAYAAKMRAWLEAHAGDGNQPPGSAPPAPIVPRILQKGCRGADVARLQEALQVSDPSVAPDGDFGQQTEDAVKAFQACHKGLVVDGVAGVMTLRALGLAR